MAFEHPFYFLRHGETTWNAIGKTQGQLDAPLSDLGRRQAANAAAIMAREQVTRIVSSPLSRARHTAEAVAETTGAEISFDPELMEFHAGELQGKPRGENVSEYFEKRWDPPGGETFAVFAARAWAALARAASEPGVLIVCHGGLWRAAQEFVAVAPRLWPMPNALPIHVSPDAKSWTARVLGAAMDAGK
ncbi:histidine phosphatase family protein [Pikeienuella piscinae]|uniref:Histidine phosphatase family protein n=1 Tax=Pikeienuella piscinae TaxID=2748098 RepID=A0A7L5BVD7_9RHOB|nr:histidine phosphatase family protein [Pikeienuella piscinae]QIE56320.1 histidine phosphatase family protein [Pikeienuella piscinae]